ncbi:MAG: DUF3592 domain-containing protein [Pseudomonadota bacterium]
MSLWHWRRHALGQASRRWRPTQGTVVDVWFDVQDVSDFDGDRHFSADAHLIYDYVVAGKRYRSRRFTYRPSRGLGEREAYALLSGIRKGQAIEVRYDPKRPQRAVVLPGTVPANLWRIVVWAAIALIAVGYALAVPAST